MLAAPMATAMPDVYFGLDMSLDDYTQRSRRVFLGALCVALMPRIAWGAPSLAALGKRYRALRARDAANPPGTFDPETDGANGELFKVMDRLRERLGKAGQPGAGVRRIMGAPDAVKDGRWIYFWRGWHDYLFFEVDERARIVRADWWMAGD